MVTWQLLSALKFKLSNKIEGQGDDFKHGVGGEKGCSEVFRNCTSTGSFSAQPSRGFTENTLEKEKISSEWYFSGEKYLVDFRGHLRMARLLRGKGTLTKITTCGMVAGCQTTRVYKSTGSLKDKIKVV